MDTSERIASIFFGLVSLIIIFVIVITMTGLHIDTGQGTHVGFVTSVETKGLIFKTNRAYIKTDTQSSQEDAYCVVDDAVLKDLRAHSEAHDRVEVSYKSWLSSGIASCKGEGEVITTVSIIK